MRVIRSIVLLTAMAAVSCGGHYHMLNQVERLLETNPAQADSMLRTIPVPEGKRMRALYAVLRTQADYKNYKDIPDDGLISQACNYYGSYQKGYHAAMAWYSRGCVLSLTDDDRETVAELMLFDEDNTLLSQGLMQGLDEELDSFLKDLLAE